MMVIKLKKKTFWNSFKYFAVSYLYLKAFFSLSPYKSKAKRILFKKKVERFLVVTVKLSQMSWINAFLALSFEKKKKDFINVYTYMDK